MSAGGAFAATDPFGFWHSTTPGTALYGVDASRHARPVGLQDIECRPAAGRTFRCGTHGGGARYVLVDRIQPPVSVNRAKLLAALGRSRISATERRRVASDLAAVPDGFLARLNTMLRFGGTYGSGSSTVPPPGVPMWLECQRAGAAVACRDLNGDEQTPVGSSIYMAVSGPGWRPAPAGAQPDDAVSSRLLKAILGHPLTPAETRVLLDLSMAVTAHGRARGGPTRAPAPPSGG